MPRISVIVPVYKAERLLPACVESILCQSFADLELILVDDGSPDGSGILCDGYAVRDPRVRVLHQANGGVSRARNAGLDVARGERVLFVDSDDTLEPEAIAVLLQTLGDGSTAACAHFNLRPDGQRDREQMPLPPGRYGREEILTALVRPLLADRTGEKVFNGFIWRYLFDRAILERGQIRFSGAYLEDEIFLLEYLCQAPDLAVTDRSLYNYYHNPDSATRRYMAGFRETFLASFARKQELVRRFALTGLGDWETGTLWAGILIAAGNTYAKGNPASSAEKCRSLRRLCAEEPFRSAIAAGVPGDLPRRKAVVAALIQKRQFTALGLLYALKNRG